MTEDKELEVKLDDGQSLIEIEIFFDMAMKLEDTKFNLYPKDSQEIQETLIKLIKQRLEYFKYE